MTGPEVFQNSQGAGLGITFRHLIGCEYLQSENSKSSVIQNQKLPCVHFELLCAYLRPDLDSVSCVSNPENVRDDASVYEVQRFGTLQISDCSMCTYLLSDRRFSMGW